MQKLNFNLKPELKNDLPERIIQFGEGNFLRCFIEWMVQQMNKKNVFNGRVVAIQPTPHGKVVDKINAQDGLYTTILRGIQDGETINKKEIITSLSRAINPYTNWDDVLKCAENPQIEFVFSNTTEAGLNYNVQDKASMMPPLSYPAKLTLYLYHRYQYFKGAPDKGMMIIPCELLEKNGQLLKNIILKYCKEWDLPKKFITWINKNNKFYTTLVDRVVSGYPTDEVNEISQELGYEDQLIDCGEPFHFFAIEGDEVLIEKLPLQSAGLNVIIEDNINKYRQRKVRLLNGGHTSNVPAAFLSGLDTVAQMMNDGVIGKFARHNILDVILPSIDMDEDMLVGFAKAVIERFENPFIKHQLISILLNSTSKFKIRVLPSLLESYKKFGSFPQELLFSFAAYIYVYKPAHSDGKHIYGMRAGKEYELNDDEENIKKLVTAWKHYDGTQEGAQTVAKIIVCDNELWGMPNKISFIIYHKVGEYLYRLDKEGSRAVIKSLL